MEKYIIEGGRPLMGEYRARGAKNAALPILAATVAVPAIHKISNCPDIQDIRYMYKILEDLGVKLKIEDQYVELDTRNIIGYCVSEELMKKMRSSIFLMGSLLTRCGKTVISRPGGCKIGDRPIDIHINGLLSMGFDMALNEEKIRFSGNVRDKATIKLPFPSVGATENLILGALGTKGEIVLLNCAKEPEIEDLQNFLNSCGANISGAGTRNILIKNSEKLHGTEYEIIGDRIEASTYLMAAVATGGTLKVSGVEPKYLTAVMSVLRKMGNQITICGKEIELIGGKQKGNIVVETGPYPAFPTDCQPQLASLLSIAEGKSLVIENIFENRFLYCDELKKMGAYIFIDGNKATIVGVSHLKGSQVFCKDLRGGAALVIAGLSAEGVTEINDIQHVCRGYESLDANFRNIGGRIEKTKERIQS